MLTGMNDECCWDLFWHIISINWMFIVGKRTTLCVYFWWPLKRPVVWRVRRVNNLSTLSTDAAGKLDVLGHDGDTLGMDGAQVGVLKKTNEVGLASLLKGHDSRALEAEVSLEVLGNLTDKALEGQLADEELSRLLVSPDLTEGNSSWPVPVGLLDSTGGRGRLSCSLGSKLLPWGLATSWFSCCLLGTSHCERSDDTDLGTWFAALFMASFSDAR